MASTFGFIALLVAPALIAWLALLFWVQSGPIVRVVAASGIGGIVLGGMTFWDDWPQGFCCREYSATLWTEGWMLLLDIMMFALPGLIPLTVLEFTRNRLRR